MAGSAAAATAMAGSDEGELLLGLNEGVMSMTSVLRALKREESSLYNCAASIAGDARFVAQVAATYPSLPRFANLRCGLWYLPEAAGIASPFAAGLHDAGNAPDVAAAMGSSAGSTAPADGQTANAPSTSASSAPPVATCYFKSTDGHNNNWSFSTVRLNLHVAEAAAAAGGALLVDATRRGKRFPDAMSKTVPIWAAVLNRAVHRLRCQRRRAAGGAAAADAAADPDAAALGEAAAAAGAAAAAAGAGGTAVQGGAEGGVADGAAAAWDCAVHLPPWVSEVEANSIRQRLDGWVDDLLGLGADLSHLVQVLGKPLRCMWVSQDSRLSLGEGQGGAADVASLAFTPLVLVGASATTARQRRCLTLPPEPPGDDPLSVTYAYFPGAADDEESWAGGLTPHLMWRHLRSLLSAGPGGIEPLLRRLQAERLAEQRAARQLQAAPRSL
ncbi:initiator tRNA phosphoribosyl [Micractinium conductrix]|uniref:Initiator tRNA phosphoribosyl n=1 Tax=Micractinium conductrix TaxID=554055 RepID=A0A2P6VF42_9CHLO|nr:initiator tRNA phosphoribosyl [Micractinium conductrix]|eukprot:PSC72713.1 initiator tRNA phosphoribosyl [Micractinium conductrix]